MRWQRERQAVAEAGAELARLGLLLGASGNVSLRLWEEGRELVAITPRGRPCASLCAEEVVVTDFEGEPVEGDLPPSSELLLHTAVYRARRDVGAVVHTHSLYASVCAVAGLEVPPLLDEVVIRLGGGVRLAEYAFPGTEDLAQRAAEALGQRNAVLLSHHGAVAVGKDLGEAVGAGLLVERAAQVFVLASLLGRATPLPPEVVRLEEALYQMRRRAESPEP